MTGPGETIVQVKHAGVCGTDLALFNGDYRVPLPHVCGHELTGTVKQIGQGVNSKWLGKTVTAEINNTCIAYNRKSLCSACKNELFSHCLERTVTGIIQHSEAFAEKLAVAAGTLHEIPNSVDPLSAKLAEPLVAVMQTFNMLPITREEIIVVLDPGRLGILIVFVAALKGLKVLAVSRSEAKRDRALDYSAIWTCSPDEADVLIRENTQRLGVDLVVDATGNPDGITQALKMTRPQGSDQYANMICSSSTKGEL
jgi:threonine dehydrogenase-like Zn-dependent dehydrogenase